ncbi:MAG: CPBP family intramembrane metalloprotease [Treponema sp.]|jgi:membrane protease YdiL (CAAX protease family)|nr:CPBP family intramembrane metalloprotease [Treponema sp.]
MNRKTFLKMIGFDLWKLDHFRIKDAVFLCLFLMGIHFLSVLPLRIFLIDLIILYDLVFFGIVIVILRKSGGEEMRKILKWRKIPVPLFFALLVMFFGMEILRRDLGNIMEMILPIPEGFFGDPYQNSIFTVLVCYSLFPAVTEELFFRGIILRRLRGNYPRGKALAVSSLLFGLMHLNPWQALLAGIAGLFLGWIYLEFKSIWLCMFVHGYSNLMAYFVPFPVEYLPNPQSYAVRVMHPPWFDIMGTVLFITGWGLTVSISRASRRRAWSTQ